MSILNQSDGGLPQVSNMMQLPPRPDRTIQEMPAKDFSLDEEVNLLAPPTQSERSSIVESNFLSNAAGDTAAT